MVLLLQEQKSFYVWWKRYSSSYLTVPSLSQGASGMLADCVANSVSSTEHARCGVQRKAAVKPCDTTWASAARSASDLIWIWVSISLGFCTFGDLWLPILFVTPMFSCTIPVGPHPIVQESASSMMLWNGLHCVYSVSGILSYPEIV